MKWSMCEPHNASEHYAETRVCFKVEICGENESKWWTVEVTVLLAGARVDRRGNGLASRCADATGCASVKPDVTFANTALLPPAN